MSTNFGRAPLVWASPDSSYGALSEESSDDLQNWFVDDDGNTLLPQPTSEPSRQAKYGLRRVPSRQTVSTMSSAYTVVPRYGVIDLSLEDICNYIDDHRGLQSAQIISTECFSERAGAVMHRFVILQLRRPTRKDIWLRLDRRRGRGVSILRFLAASGITEANDRALLSANKHLLVNEAMRENQQLFGAAPSLDEFARLLRIITEELLEYRIWPENCWFFCSLIQQHLAGSQTGWFVSGKLKYGNLANDIRMRILARVRQSRPTVAVSPANDIKDFVNRATVETQPASFDPEGYVSPPPTDAGLTWTSLSGDCIWTLDYKILHTRGPEDKDAQKNANSCLNLSLKLGTIRMPISYSTETLGNSLIYALGKVELYLSTIGDTFSSLCIRKEIVRLRRILLSDLPLSVRTDLSDELRQLATALYEAGQPAEACDADEEELAIRRQNHRMRPDLAHATLAWTLHFYAIHLHACERSADAAKADAEAVYLRRMLYAHDPEEYCTQLTVSLEHLATCLASCGRFEEARKASQEAITLRRILLEGDPTRSSGKKVRFDVVSEMGNARRSMRSREEWERLERTHKERHSRY